MTAFQPQKQNRETRETRAQNKLLAHLKKENQQLRRKLARLQKQLQKAMNARPEPDNEEVRPLESPNCPECRGALTILHLPFGALTCCKSCGWRKKS